VTAAWPGLTLAADATVLVPSANGSRRSSMIRDLSLPAGASLQLVFSVLLTGLSNTTDSPTLKIFYDEDMVFELSSAVAQHHTFRLAAWNTFKLVSFYRPALNMSVAVVGSAPGPGIVILQPCPVLDTFQPVPHWPAGSSGAVCRTQGKRNLGHN